MLIRRSAVDLRRINMDRAQKDVGEGENVGKVGEEVERELVLVVSVRCGKEQDMTRRWQLF